MITFPVSWHVSRPCLTPGYGSGGNVGLYEADGGVWKLEATRNIAGYFEEHLKDLISAGRVVVLR